jgi:tetratricopeptide (TPR) repeat protein
VEPHQIIELVKKEKYEEAISVSYGASHKEVSVAHLKLSSKFRGNAEAQEALHKAFSMLSNEDDAEKGQRLSKIEKHEEAIPHLKKAAEAKVSALNYHWLGSTLCELGRNQEALPYLRGAIELRGNAYDNHWLGRALFELDRPKEALPYIKKAVELRGSEGDKNLLKACEYKINPPPVTVKNINLNDFLNLPGVLDSLTPDQVLGILKESGFEVNALQKIIRPSWDNSYQFKNLPLDFLLKGQFRTSWWIECIDWILTHLKILGGVAVLVIVFLIWKFLIPH